MTNKERVNYLRELYNIFDSFFRNNEHELDVEELIDNSYIEFVKLYPNIAKKHPNIIKEFTNELFDFGFLENLINDIEISEIMINRFDDIYIEKDGKIIKTDYEFINEKTLSNFIERLLILKGARLDETMPFVDIALDNNIRVNIITKPVAVFGPHVTIRKFNNIKYDFKGLIKANFIDKRLESFLIDIVKKQKNILISGNTGSGKTTLLNALSEFIDNTHRIITIEDAKELQLKQEHVISLVSKRANTENNGAISIRQLLINALRMRPDRIIVGEVRGEETLDMIEAMSTGHNGSMSTIHANSARDALKRIETIISIYHNINPYGLKEKIVSAIDFIIHVMRDALGNRSIVEIHEVKNVDDNVIITETIFEK